jgi:hypothetical protein
MPAIHAVFGLITTGLVVDTRMNDTGVLTSLMNRHSVLFLKNKDLRFRIFE